MLRFPVIQFVCLSLLTIVPSLRGQDNQPTEVPDDFDASQYLLKDAQLNFTATYQGKPGRVKVHCRGEKFYLVEKTTSALEDFGDTYYLIPAEGEVRVSGLWNFDYYKGTPAANNPHPGARQNFWHYTMPSSPLTRNFPSGVMRQILYENYDDDVWQIRWYRNAVAVLTIYDRRRFNKGIRYSLNVKCQWNDKPAYLSDSLKPDQIEGNLNGDDLGSAFRRVLNHQKIDTTTKVSNDVGFTLHSRYEHTYKTEVMSERCYDARPVGYIHCGFHPSMPQPNPVAPERLNLWCPSDKQFSQLDWDNIALSDEIKQKYQFSIGGDYNELIQVNLNWNLTSKTNGPAVVLEPVDENEATWTPDIRKTPTRSYRLTLGSEVGGKVDAIRFRLEQTSSHPGVATNARHHAIYDHCPDCTLACKAEEYAVSTRFKELSFSRTHQRHNDCPIDSLPDIFFRDSDNLEFKLEETSSHEALKHEIGQQLLLEEVREDEYTVTVCIRDHAAAAHLVAEYKIDDVWHPAAVKGDTANVSGSYLMIPLDKNSDSIADHWAKEFEVKNAFDDLDAAEGGVHQGDGLTAFEEYRGVYALGEFQRLDPRRKNLFVHDFAHDYGEILAELGKMFAEMKLSLVRIDSHEFDNEVVNWTATDYKLGDQYGLVIEDNFHNHLPLMYTAQVPDGSVNWSIYDASSSHTGPPQQYANTVVLNISRAGKGDHAVLTTLGHELGHNINLDHHGTGSFINLDGKVYVAVPHGEHSGDLNCLMAYVKADYFYDKTEIPSDEEFDNLEVEAVLARWTLQKMPWKILKLLCKAYPKYENTQKHFCQDTIGTEINLDGEWCGNAKEGGCLYKIRIKSYD